MTVPPQTRICSTCGAPASSWARFCRECGGDLPAPGEQVDDLIATPEERPGVPWRAVEGIPIWLGAFLLTVVPAILAVAVDCTKGSLPAADAAACDRLFAGTLVVNEVTLLALTLGWVRLRYKLGPGALGLRRPTFRSLKVGAAGAGIGLLVAYGVSILIGLGYQLITNEQLETPKQVDLHQAPSLGMWILLGVMVVIVAPIAEETFFRGLVYRGLRRWATVPVAVTISGLVFGVAHITPLVVVSTALLGILLAAIVEREGDISAAIVTHVIFNAVGFAILAASGST